MLFTGGANIPKFSMGTFKERLQDTVAGSPRDQIMERSRDTYGRRQIKFLNSTLIYIELTLTCQSRLNSEW